MKFMNKTVLLLIMGSLVMMMFNGCEKILDDLLDVEEVVPFDMVVEDMEGKEFSETGGLIMMKDSNTHVRIVASKWTRLEYQVNGEVKSNFILTNFILIEGEGDDTGRHATEWDLPLVGDGKINKISITGTLGDFTEEKEYPILYNFDFGITHKGDRGVRGGRTLDSRITFSPKVKEVKIPSSNLKAIRLISYEGKSSRLEDNGKAITTVTFTRSVGEEGVLVSEGNIDLAGFSRRKVAGWRESDIFDLHLWGYSYRHELKVRLHYDLPTLVLGPEEVDLSERRRRER